MGKVISSASMSLDSFPNSPDSRSAACSTGTKEATPRFPRQWWSFPSLWRRKVPNTGAPGCCPGALGSRNTVTEFR